MTEPYVYLVDDDEAVRSALRLLLETVGMNIIVFADPMVFLSQLSSLSPGCIVLDIRMPVLSGLKLQEHLVDTGCDWPVIVMSGHGDIEACRRAFRNGAVDFLSKPVEEQDLIDAIQKGHAQLKKRMSEVAEHAELTALLEQLTAREREVLELISRGFTTREIADSLELSPRTVESHRSHIAAKFGTSSAAEMARILVESDKSP